MLSEQLEEVYRVLHRHFGPRRWWPADSAFEVVVGAVLTQNTAWTNVEQAIANLARAGLLTPARLAAVPRAELEALIRPAGFFRQKAERLQTLARHLDAQWRGRIADWCGGPLDEARHRLLQHRGIGPETADSILLYAAHRPSFVVDAYTRRVFGRLGLLGGGESYAAVRALFMQHLPADAALYNEYHALIVALAKTFCRKRRPLCTPCPLLELCPYGREVLAATPG